MIYGAWKDKNSIYLPNLLFFFSYKTLKGNAMRTSNDLGCDAIKSRSCGSEAVTCLPLLHIVHALFSRRSFMGFSSFKQAYAEKLFDVIEEYALGFNKSVEFFLYGIWNVHSIWLVHYGTCIHSHLKDEDTNKMVVCRREERWVLIRSRSYVSAQKSSSPKTPLAGLFLCENRSHSGGELMVGLGIIFATQFTR